MSANLFESAKELGVLRSIGITTTRIKVLYFYEAFLMVLASCVLGTLIGSSVGYVVCIQQNLFTVNKNHFVFPTEQLFVILACSLLCAFLSTYGPTSHLTKKQISEMFRMV
jgi:ABC-type antimicrobial peptide transport system permease subunit